MKKLKFIGFSMVLGSTLPSPLAAMEQEPNEQERKTISKQIASHADNLIKQWKQQETKHVILAGHNLDTKQEKFVSPLVNKILFQGLKDTQKIDTINLSDVAAYIMHQIGTYAAKHSTYSQDGLLIVSSEPKDAPRVQTFEGSSSTDDFPIMVQGRFGEEKIIRHFENKIVFSKATEDKLNTMAKDISEMITKANNFDLVRFIVDKKYLPPNYNAEAQALFTPCHFDIRLKKHRESLGKGVLTHNVVKQTLQNINMGTITIGNNNFHYFFNYCGS